MRVRTLSPGISVSTGKFDSGSEGDANESAKDPEGNLPRVAHRVKFRYITHCDCRPCIPRKHTRMYTHNTHTHTYTHTHTHTHSASLLRGVATRKRWALLVQYGEVEAPMGTFWDATAKTTLNSPLSAIDHSVPYEPIEANQLERIAAKARACVLALVPHGQDFDATDTGPEGNKRGRKKTAVGGSSVHTPPTHTHFPGSRILLPPCWMLISDLSFAPTMHSVSILPRVRAPSDPKSRVVVDQVTPVVSKYFAAQFS
jgi:hypothetical protein